MTAEVHLYNAANSTKLSELSISGDDVVNLRASVELNTVGTCRFDVGADHTNAGDIAIGNVVRLLDNTSLVAAYTITKIEDVEVTDDDSDKVLRVEAKDLLHRWDWSRVDPWIAGTGARPVSLTRVFDWASPELDLTGWGDVYSRPGVEVSWNRAPHAYPTAPVFGAWIWSSSLSPGSPPWSTETAGESLFRASFTLLADATLVFYPAGNGNWDLRLDGTEVVSEPALYPDRSRFEDTRRYVVACSAGTHYIGIRCDKQGPGLSGVLLSVFEVDGDIIGDAVISTAAGSSFDWTAQHHPSTFPGHTAPEILQILLDEAQARNELTGWTIVTNGTHDEIEEFAVPVGASYLDVIDALSATYVDVWADPSGLTLNLWPKATGRGSASGVTFTVGTDIEFTSAEQVDDSVDVVQAVWAKGVRRRPASTPGTVRRSETLRLGRVSNLRAVDEIADAYLSARSSASESVVVRVAQSTGKQAGVDYDVGDTVNVGGRSAVRCVGLTYTRDDSGIVALPEFETMRAVRSAEKLRAVERMTAGFDAPASAEILDVGTKITSGVVRTESVSWSWSGPLDERVLEMLATNEQWQAWRPERTVRLYSFEFQLPPDKLAQGGGTSTLELMKNGSKLNALYDLSITGTATESDTVAIYGLEVVDPSDYLSIRWTAAGDHIDGQVTLRFADAV